LAVYQEGLERTRKFFRRDEKGLARSWPRLYFLKKGNKMQIDEAAQNIGIILTKSRITMQGQPLTGEETLALIESHKLLVDTIKVGQDAVAELAELKNKKD
jgi:hypothetical protein